MFRIIASSLLVAASAIPTLASTQRTCDQAAASMQRVVTRAQALAGACGQTSMTPAIAQMLARRESGMTARIDRITNAALRSLNRHHADAQAAASIMLAHDQAIAQIDAIIETIDDPTVDFVYWNRNRNRGGDGVSGGDGGGHHSGGDNDSDGDGSDDPADHDANDDNGHGIQDHSGNTDGAEDDHSNGDDPVDHDAGDDNPSGGGNGGGGNGGGGGGGSGGGGGGGGGGGSGGGGGGGSDD